MGKQRQYVYIQSDEHTWAPAVQVDVRGSKAVILRPLFKTEQAMLQCGNPSTQKYTKEETVDLKDYPNGVLPMQNVDSNGSLEDFKDMVSLPFMHEAALLYNLKRRHISEKPYTRTGDIVIAVNPYQWLDELYTEKKKRYYSNRLVWDQSEEDPRDSMEPHVYEVSALSYKGLASLADGQDQSVLVSGESGAGKTETVKILLNHIASTQQGRWGDNDTANDPIVQRIVDSNPLLEAFGNAKTRRNDNSSRFGKYLQLQFNKGGKGSLLDVTTRCELVGSKCEVYLLEKNRVVSHERSERTFHIFYQLLASPKKTQFWDKLSGTSYESFKYVGKTSTNKIEGVHDSDRFDETLQALELVNVSGARLNMLMQAICVVLQLGNLSFEADPRDSDRSTISTSSDLADLADLMEVSNDDLVQAFTKRTFETKAEKHSVPLNAEAAKEACDALAKEVYQKVFLWLVTSINGATSVDESFDCQLGLIGLLDIFGFESFTLNRFEQLCINYANEKLQQKFTEDVFRSVQEEYEAEGIPLKDVWYDDNTDVLDLIEGRTGLLALLNEECVRPKGNDQEFVQKALKANKDSNCLVVNRTDRMSFGIQHYAGEVMYDAEFFVSRNQDTLPTDLQQCAEKCSNGIVRSARSEPVVQLDPAKNRKSKSRLEQTRPKRKESNIVQPTVWTKYKNQLSNLMGMLRQTRSRYIRCIKPNSLKAPLLMEHAPVVEQLRCAGVSAAITITRSVFPNSLQNTVVLARYSSLWEPNAYPSKRTRSMSPQEKRAEDCKACLKGALKSKRFQRDDGEIVDAFVVGKTKTYFRAGALEFLELNRISDLDSQAIVIQKAARGWLVRNGGNSAKQRRQKEEEELQRRRQQEITEKEERRKRQVARQKEREAQLDEIKRRMRNIQHKMDEKDREADRQIEQWRERAREARREKEALEELMADRDIHRERREAEEQRAQAFKKLEENKKLIEFLKKENKQARKGQAKVQVKHDKHKEQNGLLHDSNSSMGFEFDELNEATKQVNDKMEDRTFVLNKAKQQNKKLRDSVSKAQDRYMSQAEARLEYQKTMARILNLIQDKCYQTALVEDTVVTALECEAEAKAIMAALEAETEPFLIGSDISESSHG